MPPYVEIMYVYDICTHTRQTIVESNREHLRASKSKKSNIIIFYTAINIQQLRLEQLRVVMVFQVCKAHLKWVHLYEMTKQIPIYDS